MAAMQEAMKRPEVQAQMQQMSAAMQNQQLQERMATLKVHLPVAYHGAASLLLQSRQAADGCR